MELNDLATSVMKYRKPSAGVFYALLNLSGEVGELHSKVAKQMRDETYDLEDNEEQQTYLNECAKELGDVVWCVIAVAEDMGFSFEDIGQMLKNKLDSRASRGTLEGSGDNR